MNLSIFGGNFVRKPELKQVGDANTSVVNFTIAVNRVFNSRDGEKKKEVTYLDCEAWDSGAETIARNCNKGDYIIIYASVKNENWTDATTGNKRSRVKFRVDRFEFVPGVRRRSNEDEELPQSAPDTAGDDEPGSEDIPF